MICQHQVSTLSSLSLKYTEYTYRQYIALMVNMSHDKELLHMSNLCLPPESVHQVSWTIHRQSEVYACRFLLYIQNAFRPIVIFKFVLPIITDKYVGGWLLGEFQPGIPGWDFSPVFRQNTWITELAIQSRKFQPRLKFKSGLSYSEKVVLAEKLHVIARRNFKSGWKHDWYT